MNKKEAIGSEIKELGTTMDSGHSHLCQVDESGNGETDIHYDYGDRDQPYPVKHFHTIESNTINPAGKDNHTHHLLTHIALNRLTDSIQESVGTHGKGQDHIFIVIKEAVTDSSVKPEGNAYLVQLIKTGLSENRNLYERGVLKGTVPQLRELDIKAYVDHSKEFSASRPPGEIAGGFDKKSIVWNEADGTIDALFYPTLPWLKEAMLNAAKADMPYLYQFSIDAIVDYTVENYSDGKPIRRVLSFEKMNSTDVVDRASAGGAVKNMAHSRESMEDESMNTSALVKELQASVRNEMAAFLASPEFWAEVKKAIMSDPDEQGNKTMTGVKIPAEILDQEKKPRTEPVCEVNKIVNKTDGAKEKSDLRTDVLEQQMLAVRNRQNLKEMIEEAKFSSPFHIDQINTIVRELAETLPEKDFAKIAKRTIEVQKATAAANAQEVANLTQNGTSSKAEVTEANRDKFQNAVHGFFEGKDVEGTPRYQSIKQIYFDITGDHYFTGNMVKEKSLMRASEAIDTNTFTKILGDSITRKIQKDFVSADNTVWKKVVSDFVPRPDFRTQRRMIIGGYGNLPTVLQGGSYTALTSPGDVEVTYALSKRGGTEKLTEETIRNDDVGFVQKIPQRLVRAAANQLNQFVFNTLIVNNPTYGPDSVALFNAASHSNDGTSALSQGALDAVRAAMRKQKPYGETIVFSGLRPKYLLIPPNIEGLAISLAKQPISVIAPGDTSNQLGINIHALSDMEVIVLDFLSDVNDWFAVGDPNLVPTIEMGFLDGQEIPQLLIQANPTVGSWFDSDSLTFKIKHVYSGVVLDYRSFYRNVVAG